MRRNLNLEQLESRISLSDLGQPPSPIYDSGGNLPLLGTQPVDVQPIGTQNPVTDPVDISPEELIGAPPDPQTQPIEGPTGDFPPTNPVILLT